MIDRPQNRCPHIQLSLTRELGLSPRESFRRSSHFSIYFAHRLHVEHVLEGHTGCVNRLAWNEDGSRLASGSDDRKLMMWSVPDCRRPPLCITTPHRANIFGVQILPQTNDARLVSVSMDHTVQLHSLDHTEVKSWATSPAPLGAGSRATGESRPIRASTCTSQVYFCHTSRVKDVRTEPMNPHNFWSASEDGSVRQFDTRVSHQKQDNHEAPNVLLTASSSTSGRGGSSVEIKSLDINKVRPHLIAVGCSDPFVRVYDRRMLGPSRTPTRGGEALGQPLARVAPAHLSCVGMSRHSLSHATYVNFSSNGDRLLTSYHGDHAYTFDLASALSGSSAPSSSVAFLNPAAWCGSDSGTQGQQRSSIYPSSNATSPGGYANPRTPSSPSGHHAHSSPWGLFPSHSSSPVATDSTIKQGSIGNGGGGSGSLNLPDAAEEARRRANRLMLDEDWPAAITELTEAVRLAPWCALLYARRAEALLGRGWQGDALYALQDCEAALAADPTAIPTAHVRRIRALMELKQLQCARLAADEYIRVFPERAHSEELRELTDRLDRCFHQRGKQREQWLQQRQRTRQARKEALRSINEGRSTPRPPRAAEPSPTPPPAPNSNEPRRAAGSNSNAADGASTSLDTHPSPRGERDVPSGNTTEDLVVNSHQAEGVAGGGGGLEAASAGPTVAPSLRRRREWDSSSSDGGSDEDDDDYDAEDPSREVFLPYYQDLLLGSSSTSGSRSGSDSHGLRAALHGHVDQRFIGHRNLQTDIKEAVFVGRGDKLVACGSDDGRVYIYCSETGVLLRTLRADEDVVNCVQPHPTCAMLATSGIENVVRLWSPGPEPTGEAAEALQELVSGNQGRNRQGSTTALHASHLRDLADNPDLYGLLLSHLRERVVAAGVSTGDDDDGDDDEDEEEEGSRRVQCRVN